LLAEYLPLGITSKQQTKSNESRRNRIHRNRGQGKLNA